MGMLNPQMAMANQSAMWAAQQAQVAPAIPAKMSPEEFAATHQLKQEAIDVLMSLSPEIQDTVLTQFRCKTALPGSYEMNGKFIMFARSVERNAKGKGKGKEAKGW